LEYSVRQYLAPSDIDDEFLALAMCEASQYNRCHVRARDPTRCVLLRAMRYYQHNRQARQPRNQSIEQFLTGRVDPVGILEDHQQRLEPRECFKLTLQSAERLW
jgi:hypothetical protein